MSWLREPNAEPIPGYRLIEPLGSGGFGEVWKCEAPGGLFKAIKFVYGNLHSLDVDGVRAEQELHALQRIKELRHPFICTLEQIKEVEGELVIVMELADRSLHDLFIENQSAGLIGIPRDDLLRYMRDASEALDYMNEKHKLQHLDIKPRNLFLISDRVKVADFGLVKHLERQTASGLLGGVTPLYAAPETFKGKISERSDQYSLALVYHELLTGRRPFNGKNVRALMQQHVQEEPDLRALPEVERPIIGRALAKDPAKRYPNCMALLRALYATRPHTRLTAAAAEVNGSRNGSRPKTMAETMEDILLEAPVSGVGKEESDGSDMVDLGASPPNGEEAGVEVSELGITVAQPATGALRPTLIVGLGSFGRKALLELRCRFLDRFGDLSKLPILKFLCIDVDPEAVNLAVRGAPEVALTKNEIHQLPLQPVGNYRRRAMNALADWLPREKLYAMPRSLQTQGSRALGRLAFADNQQRLLARLKREIAQATNPDTLYASVSATGLALRDNTPRVYVLASAAGGSSGMLADLGYALTRLLAQMGYAECQVQALLLTGAANDPATPRAEQANVYATLTELNHFSDPSNSFSAQYGADGQNIADTGSPFHCVYLIPLSHRSPEALDDAVAHLGSYLFHELTTPLGIRLEATRRAHGANGVAANALMTPFRSFGTYAVWFPRGLLLCAAARNACRRLTDEWLAPSDATLPSEVLSRITAIGKEFMANAGLKAAALERRIEHVAAVPSLTELEAAPAEALTRMLAAIEEQSQLAMAAEDPGSWARQAIGRVREWVGGGELSHEGPDWRKTKINKALAIAVQKVAEEWDQALLANVSATMEHPGPRFAAAEAALQQIIQFCREQGQTHKERLDQQMSKTRDAWDQVELGLQECVTEGGGFRIFSGRTGRRQLRSFVDNLAHFARQRLADELVASCRYFFGALGGRLQDRLRDLQFCRQRLRHLQQRLECPIDEDGDDSGAQAMTETMLGRSPMLSTEAYYEGLRQSATARVVLPDGEQELDRAAIRLLQRLKPDEWNQLDRELHEHVILPRGGLHSALMTSGDMIRNLMEPMLEEAISLLSRYMPIMDVAQILGAEFGLAMPEGPVKGKQKEPNGEELAEHIRSYLDRAAPMLKSSVDKSCASFLLLPASDIGRRVGDAVHKVVPDLKLVRVPGQSDLMFCREQGCLRVEDLHKLMKQFRASYDAAAGSPPTSPHARFDIVDWLPLDP